MTNYEEELGAEVQKLKKERDYQKWLLHNKDLASEKQLKYVQESYTLCDSFAQPDIDDPSYKEYWFDIDDEFKTLDKKMTLDYYRKFNELNKDIVDIFDKEDGVFILPEVKEPEIE